MITLNWNKIVIRGPMAYIFFNENAYSDQTVVDFGVP